MRNLIMGGIGVLIGLFILVAGWLRKDPNPGGAFGTGMIIGDIFGWLFLIVGGIYFVLGILEVRSEMGYDEPGPRRKKKKKKRPAKPLEAKPVVQRPAPTPPKDDEGEWEDEEEEPRSKRRPIHIHPLVWILGGSGVAVILLVLGVVWLFQFLSTTPSGLPPEAKKAHDKFVALHGAECVLTIEVRGVSPTENERSWASTRVYEIVSEMGAKSSTGQTVSLTEQRVLVIAVSTNPAQPLSVDDFVRRVDFGKVDSVSERKRYIVIEADKQRLGELATAKKWWRPFDPPPWASSKASERGKSEPPPSSTAPERSKSESSLRLVRIECLGLDKPVAAVEDALRRRLAKSLPDASVVVVVWTNNMIVVSLRSREPLGEIAKRLDLARLVSTDERRGAIVLEFTPEHVAALSGETTAAPPRDKPPESPPKPGEPSPSKPADSPPTRLAGLIAHWNFDDGEGDTVKDMSGNGLDAKLIGCRRGEGIRGKGVVMTGKDQYVDLGKDPRLNFRDRQAFTIALWARTTERDGTVFSFRNSASGAPVIDITWGFGTPEAAVRSDGREVGEVRLRDASRPAARGRSDGQWRHIAITRNGDGEIALFLDGTLATTGSPSRFNNTAGAITTDLRALGNERYHKLHRGMGNPDFIGSIDEVQIHGSVLSADEIRKLATK